MARKEPIVTAISYFDSGTDSNPGQDIIEPVARQLDAYNAKDIDGFMQHWAPDCRIYAFPDTLLADGAAEIRSRHIERFREPDLHGKLIARHITGNMVTDIECVTRNFPEGKGEIDVLCLYEIEHGKIARAWFRMGEKRLLG
nr:nuclear transport factor 2 family protein [Agrobacterium vitis]